MSEFKVYSVINIERFIARNGRNAARELTCKLERSPVVVTTIIVLSVLDAGLPVHHATGELLESVKIRFVEVLK